MTFKITRKKIIFSVIGLLLFLTFLFLPSLVKNYAVSNSKELLGRQISIDKLKFNYFTSTTEVYDFKMYEENAKDVFIKFDTLIVDINPLELLDNHISLERFLLDGLDATVIMQDSSFNFDDLITFFSTPEDSVTETSNTEESFSISLANLELKNGGFHLNNQEVEHKIDMEAISVIMPSFTFDQNTTSKAEIQFNLKDGGSFETALDINPNAGDYQALIAVNGLKIDSFYNYIKDYALINSIKGLINADLNLAGNINNPINSILAGDVEVHDFAMTDKSDKLFLGFKKIESKLNSIDYAQSRYIIEDIKIDNSYTNFKLEAETNNFFEIFMLDSTETTSENVATEDSTDLYYSIAHLEINKGVLDYTDNLTGKPFKYHLSEIQNSLDNISSDMENVHTTATMILNNRGNLKSTLDFNLNDHTKHLDLDILIDRFLLSDLNIYTGHYIGHNFIEGDMYYHSTTNINNGNLKVENKLLVKNTKLKTSKKGLYKLPLKFAFFLLTDKNGEIELDMPVRGDLNDPDIKIGKIIWKTFKNVISKTVAKPVNLLANLIVGDPKDLEVLKYSYLDSTLTKKHIGQLDKLLKLEEKKKDLNIELSYLVDVNLEKEAFAKAQVGERFNSETQKDYQEDLEAFETYIHEKVEDSSLESIRAILKLADKSVIDSIANKIVLNRLEEVSTYLKTKSNGNSKIIVKQAAENDSGNIGATPQFRIKYGLKE